MLRFIIFASFILATSCSESLWSTHYMWWNNNPLPSSRAFRRYQKKVIVAFICERLFTDKLPHEFNASLQRSWLKNKTQVSPWMATQYRVNESNVKDGYYKLMRPESQTNHTLKRRSSVPKLTLDELLEKRCLWSSKIWQRKCQLMDILLLKPWLPKLSQMPKWNNPWMRSMQPGKKTRLQNGRSRQNQDVNAALAARKTNQALRCA